MTKVDDVVAGEPIEASWGNQSIRNRTVQRATSIADRNASWPAPEDGETVWIADVNQLHTFNGTVWIVWASEDFVAAGFLPLTGGNISGGLSVAGLLSAAGELNVSGNTVVTGRVEGGSMNTTTAVSFGIFRHRNVWINRTPTSPTGILTGDIWIDAESGTVQAWSGSAWVLLIQGVV